MSKRKVHLHVCDSNRVSKFYKDYTKKAFRRKFMKDKQNYDITPNSLNKEFCLSWWC